MGSGSSKIDNISRSFNETMTENIKQTMINKSAEFGATMGAIQRLSITDIDCAGDINISEIQQKVVMKYNFSQIDKMMDSTQLNEMMTNAVQNTLDSETSVKSEFAATGGGVDQDNINESINRNVNRLVNSVDMNYFTSVMADMEANQDAVLGRFTSRNGGDCNVNNISQDIAMDVAASQLAEKVTDELVAILRENENLSDIKQKTSVASTGFFGDMGRGIANITQSLFSGIGGIVQTVTQPAIVLGILLIVAILAWLISRAFTSGKVADVNRPPPGQQPGQQPGQRPQAQMGQSPFMAPPPAYTPPASQNPLTPGQAPQSMFGRVADTGLNAIQQKVAPVVAPAQQQPAQQPTQQTAVPPPSLVTPPIIPQAPPPPPVNNAPAANQPKAAATGQYLPL
jgi:hypothetical protein